MSKKRNKIHKPGERLSVYLNKDLPDHFFEWIAKQDDVSAFVIYALEQLYSETGNKNVANMLPRRFHFEDIKTSFPDNTSNFPIKKSEIEVPKETKLVKQADAEELNEESITPKNNTRIERDNQQREFVQEPVIAETSTSEIEHDEINESEDNSLETNKWANLGNVDPDNF